MGDADIDKLVLRRSAHFEAHGTAVVFRPITTVEDEVDEVLRRDPGRILLFAAGGQRRPLG
jgi:hypothetical protein